MEGIKKQTDLVVKKGVGWLLLIAGVAMIFWAIYSSYEIFTAQKPVPHIFKISPEQTSKLNPSRQTAQEQMQNLIREQLEKIFPSSFSVLLFNLISWSIFAWILIVGGYRIGLLGMKLIK